MGVAMYGSTGGCGANTAAGKNGNRTSFTDTQNTTTVTSATYCYDWADRLTSSNATTAGGNPVLNSDLVTVGPLPSLVYDTHGNTTRLADQQMNNDIADRHMSTTLDDGTTIVYLRDATGRVVARTTDTPTEAPVSIRYTSGGAMTAILDTTGAVLQRSITLPGGVQVTFTGTVQLWSYPNIHGDVILTADATGNRSTMATARRVPPAVGRPQSGARVTRRVWVGASEHPQSCSTPQQPRFQKVIDFPGFLLEHIFECEMIDSCPSPSLSPAPHSRSSRSHWWMPRLLPH